MDIDEDELRDGGLMPITIPLANPKIMSKQLDEMSSFSKYRECKFVLCFCFYQRSKGIFRNIGIQKWLRKEESVCRQKTKSLLQQFLRSWKIIYALTKFMQFLNTCSQFQNGAAIQRKPL